MSNSGKAEIEITASTRQLPTALRRALKMVQGFVHQTTGLMDPKKQKDPDAKSLAIGAGIGGVASQLAMRGIDMLVDQTKQVFDFNKELIRFGIDIRKMPSDMEAIGKGIRDISNATGVGAMDVLKAGRAYADLAGAEAFTMDKMSLIARAAQASGADVKDMASLLFTLTENLNVPPGQLEDTIGGLINQAKDGSIHFRELSQELVALGPVYKQYGVAGREGAIQLGAMMQVARRGFGSASEAGTGVLRILRSIPQHASKFRKFGINVFEDGSKSKLDNFLSIFKKIRESKLQLDREALIKAFGRTEGERFYQLLVQSAEQFEKLNVAGRENGTIAKDLGTFTESSAGRVDVAMQKMKNAFAAALTPERVDQIVSGIQRIAEAMPAIMSAVGAVSDAFSAFVHAVSKAKNALAGKSHYKNSDEEKALLGGLTEEGRGKTVMWTSADRARALGVKKRNEEYNKTIDSIMAGENDFGATDESIKRALRVAMPSEAGPNGKSMPGSGAGVDYLAGRAGEITESRYKRLSDEVQAERDKAMGPYAASSRRYQQAEAEDRAKANAQAEYMRQHIQPMINKVAGQIGDAIGRAVNAKPTQVVIDGNPVAKAAANAPDGRRK